ncbi:hypothetical protein Q4511_13850 [Paracoccus sp. 1_MG-2023]|uniref:hypothetical protein n=1 Tax=unclassified Paracoccus (in: a-proteobacteria) TaxID=2688777 RepID=UPI001C09A907|nr:MULTISPECIES: hypothetical protein [unclassified Paracoccus (in: a-proteobacteria)]MBU2958857.1 hypothetical protein [Paracoccus sp. C2R09]MDO6670012.1 hypothetical protein [Paracoccus sp. 1_MG-2023]
MPDAVEVLHDAPNVFSWSRFQTGRIGDFTYRLFPDASAIIVAASGRPFAEYMLKCTRGEECRISNDTGVIMIVPAIAAPKPPLPQGNVTGLDAAQYLAEWILAGTGTRPPPPPDPAPAAQFEGPVLPLAEDLPEEPAEADPADPEPEIDQNNLLPPEVDCLEPDPFYPDACSVPEPRRRAVVAATPVGDVAAPVTAPPPPPEDNRPRTLAERFKLACSLTTGMGLQYTDPNDYEDAYGKARVSLGCNVRLQERVSLSLALIHFPISGQKAPWDPDFTYALNMRVTEKLSLGYSNYSARFSGGNSDLISSLLTGSLRASYKLPPLPLPMDREAQCSVSIGLSNPGNDSGSLSCGMTVNDKLRLGLTLYAYPSGTQEPWNPDYSYTASYKINDRIQLNYSNYSSNRWPWNRGSSPGPGMLGGSLSLSYKLLF